MTDFSRLFADLNVTWSDQLQSSMGDFTRSPGGGGSLPQMVQLVTQSENALGLISDCLLDLAGGGAFGRSRLTVTRLDQVVARLEWDHPGILRSAFDVTGRGTM